MPRVLSETENLLKLYDRNSGVWKVIKRSKQTLKSIKIIENALLDLGLSRNEAKVYLFLAKVGKSTASKVAEAVSLNRTEIYRVLKGLERKGLVSLVLEKPTKFVAVPFENAVSGLIEAEEMKLKMLEQRKDRLLEIWASLPRAYMDSELREVFQILEGSNQIESKARELLESTKYEFCVFISEDIIGRLYHSGFLDELERISKKGVDVRLIAGNSPKIEFFIKEMKFKNVKYVLMDARGLPFFLISDEKEVLLMLRKNRSNFLGEMMKNSKAVVLWTNYYALTRILYRLFIELWNQNLEER